MRKHVSSIWPLALAIAIVAAALAALTGASALAQGQRDRPMGDVHPEQVPTGVRIPITFQQGVSPAGYAGCQDTYIVSWYGYRDYNYCSSSNTQVRSGDQEATLIRFDVSSIPAAATILSAELRLYVEWTSGAGLTLPLGVYQVNRPWNVCEATWYNARSEVYWQSPGANHVSNDRSGSAVSSVTMAAASTWYTWDVASLVQSWVAAPQANQGMILKSFFADYSVGFGFASANHGGTQFRPRLEVVYALLPDTPTPTGTSTSTPTATATGTPTRTATVSPTATATGTSTAPPTSSTTPTMTHTPSNTPTATPTVVGLLVGTIRLQGRGPTPDEDWRVPLTVALYSQGLLQHQVQVTTETDGSFRVPDIRSDFYDITVKNVHTLRNRREGVLIVPGVTSVFMGVLLEGDANDDNRVDIVDFSLFRVNFGRPSATGDFNGDGFVDIEDFSLLRGNFGLYGDIVITP